MGSFQSKKSKDHRQIRCSEENSGESLPVHHTNEIGLDSQTVAQQYTSQEELEFTENCDRSYEDKTLRQV